MDTTLDGLLNRRVMLEQPAQGYRVAVDTVLLAASVAAQAGDKVLDFGCGAGGAMLCLAARVPGISVTGIEIQPELAELCRRNIARNNFKAQMDVMVGDVTKIFGEVEQLDSPPLEGGARGGAFAAKTEARNFGADPPPNLRLREGGTCAALVKNFCHVLMNPPYHDAMRHDVSFDATKRTANTEKDGDLQKWIAAAARTLKSGGMLTLIHRADRGEEILSYASRFFGGIEVLPVLPKADAPPRRIIIRAVKDAQPAVRECKNFVLHRADGGYTDAAENILRHAKNMDFI